ncbi:chemotaxis protein [Pseudoalteromonas sp. SR41-4]|jgi:chemotaxis signal transduction protein|uniref:chemotaxis protein n=1 Tax=Pseudoalteromonas sp. SR41-4 TaxID=2760950 RepID=UPI0016007690|nr:chemotaxis protein [Pseudoalteromonas sp. SR41-4]MBB1294183.1 chemotaxis protein [Pseudoalteromonas sp. SR41-4]
MDLINFRVGQKTISLKILDILLTERFEDNLTSLPNDNKSFIGVKDYMETPTPIFDLGIILNKQSTQATNLSLVDLFSEWEQKQHEWFFALENSINQNQPFNHNTDIQQSNFAKWYSSFKTENEDLKAIIERFKIPHARLYSRANKLIELVKKGNPKQALIDLNIERNSNFMQLIRLFESAKEQIVLDYKPIIIFTTKDGRNPHIGLLVDKVEDNISYKKEDIKPLDKLTDVGFDIDPQTKNMMRGLIKLEHKHSVLIDPSAIFRPDHLMHQHAEETAEYGLF